MVHLNQLQRLALLPGILDQLIVLVKVFRQGKREEVKKDDTTSINKLNENEET